MRNNQVKAHKVNIVAPHGATITMFWSNSNQDRWGDEFEQWFASFGDDDGEPVGKVWRVSSREEAADMAYSMMVSNRMAECIEY